MVKDFNTEQVLHLAFTGGDSRRKNLCELVRSWVLNCI